MQKDFFHVIVLGGGIVGKACALSLADQGLKVAWVAPPKPSAERVYALSASTQSLLTELRVWQTIPEACLQPVSAMDIFADATRRTPALHFSAYMGAVSQLAWIVQGRDIEHGLDTALSFAKRVTAIATEAKTLQVTTEAVSVTLESGISLRAECLVGADGACSWTCAQADISREEKAYRQTAVVAQFLAEQPHHGIARQWFINGEILALLPLPNNYISIVWSAGDEHAKALLAMDAQALAAYLQDTATIAQYTGTLQGLSTPTGYPLYFKRAHSLIAPRIALVGDAAHVVHPLAGQGLNIGLADVATLSRIFSEKESFRQYGEMRLLQRYARARALDIQLMMNVIDGLQHCFELPGEFFGKIRHLGLQAVDSTPWVKKFLIKSALN